MNAYRNLRFVFSFVLAVWAAFSFNSAHAQISSVVFQDDFSATTIDPAKYQADAPFFEGGVGDIHAEIGSGVMKFVGKTTQQWWSGGTLRLTQTYDATEDANAVISIDRVAEAGMGSASRSALWILDESKTKYVLFADVRGEGGWHFNRKIGQTGDVPTGGGTDIGPFNGGSFDDGMLHRMQIVANGQTVKLYLDGIFGVEVPFPYSKVIFQFGSYARANNDTADTTWDNLRVEVARKTAVVFEDNFASNTIDPAKYQPDAPFFEGGVGDIHAEAGNGVMKFVGRTTQQWWSGGTLRIVPTFKATEATPVLIGIDRVAEAGVGSASRSALWVLDPTRTKYVLFADVRAEGGWRYNRKIGETGDVPTGSGTDIAAFNGGNFDDGMLHRMGILADGKTVKLILDGQTGAEVKFPFSDLTVEFGSYARANNDTADTTWDNLKIERVPETITVIKVFQDDFSSGTLPADRYVPDAPFFEGGVGDIHAVTTNGVLKFVGTTSQQWWSGGTLRIQPSFQASEDSTVSLTVDRVAEAGVGSASRSALWVLDSTRTKYVLFADVRAEGGWRYNRKIGENGDVPTGSGTDIAAFNGGTFDNGGLHQMKVVADGRTVKLILDGVQGAEVRFPFDEVIFELGAYARANNDTADTTWDNLCIEKTGTARFVPGAITVRRGQTSSDLMLQIPEGANLQSDVQVRITSTDTNVAVPVGGTGGQLTLTFPRGGGNTATFRVQALNFGGAQFTASGIAAINQLNVAVISGPTNLLCDNFVGAAISNVWQVSNRPFESGSGTFTVGLNGGMLEIIGTATADFWPGAALMTRSSFVATKELNLVVEFDRVLIDGTTGGGGQSSAVRSTVFLTTADHSRFIAFSQNVGETGWSVNLNPGSPTGGGQTIAAFTDLNDGGSHHVRLVADGETVEIFLDGRSGGRFNFPVSAGIFVELAAFARASGDQVTAQFDNVKIANALPCVTVSPVGIFMTEADRGREFTITIPTLLHDIAPASVTIRTRDQHVALPSGATNGTLVLNFPVGGPDTQSVTVQPTGRGATMFDISSTPSVCMPTAVSVEVVAAPQMLLADNFSGATYNTNVWRFDDTGFLGGTVREGSTITISNGQVRILVTNDVPNWPGLGLFTVANYSAEPTMPVTFEIDRVSLGFVLVTGTGARQRTGIWIKNATGNFVFFADHVAHDGNNFGWRYNRSIGQEGDNPDDAGVELPALNGPSLDDQGRHRMKMVANGLTVKLYLDDILGAEVPFPFTFDLTFGFGAYVGAANDVVIGTFDNAKIAGEQAPYLTSAIRGGNLVLNWTVAGTLEETDALTSPPSAIIWRAVTPAPVGTTYSIPVSRTGMKYYRIRR